MNPFSISTFFKKLFPKPNMTTTTGSSSVVKPVSKPHVYKTPPWIVEILKVYGLHELRDKVKLMAWLKSDKKTLGDPSKLPWCGDAVETAMKLGLPKEPMSSDLKQNPYWARNWLSFGVPVPKDMLFFGMVAIFARGTGGHVGFVVGHDPVRKVFKVLGGNQSDAVIYSSISTDRLLGLRWPSSYEMPNASDLPKYNSNEKLSTNEA